MKKTMSTKLSIFLVLSVLLFSALSAGAEDKQKKIKVNWRIAGTIVQLVDVTSPVPSNPPPEPLPHSMIKLAANGSPGKAEITLLSKTTQEPLDCFDCFECDEGYGYPVYFDKNEMVAIFPDQSLLFASIDKEECSILCFGYQGTYFKVKMNVTGGTGRFKKVTGGVLIGEGNGYPVGPDSTLAGEDGKIEGWIYFD